MQAGPSSLFALGPARVSLSRHQTNSLSEMEQKSHTAIPMDRQYMDWLDVRSGIANADLMPEPWSIQPENTGNNHEHPNLEN
jgi:hypothetical protein